MKPLRNAPLRGYAASPELVAESIVRAALLEDLGHGGDLTTDAIVESDRFARARVVARRDGIIAGFPYAALAFTLLEARMESTAYVGEGERIRAAGVAAEIFGPARAILSGERTALNLLGRLCGIATATRTLVDLVTGTRARIADTRKTTPGLRALERYAVACGGGSNHRFGLDDAVLIKDNHLAIAGSIHQAVAAVRARVGHMVKVEIEVDDFDQLREALAEPIDAVLLDNMTPSQLTEAVRLVHDRVLIEASGGVNESNVAQIAATGVDIISVGALTHSAPSLDFTLEIIAH